MTKPTLILLRGVSGSGKSTVSKLFPNFEVVEADQFFMHNGEYRFHPDRLTYAHTWCKTRTKKLLSEGKNVVVSNTSTREQDVVSYQNIAYDMDSEFYCLEIIND